MMITTLEKPLLIGLAALAFMPPAAADVSYDSSAAISYTVNSITNTNPNDAGDLSGLTITGAFQQLTDANDFYANTTGDGAYQANDPAIPSSPALNNAFAGTYAVSGDTAAYGTVSTLNTGQFSLDFTNSGVNTYTIDVTLNYTLNAVASGLFANSAIQLDYWDTGNNVNGQDSVTAGTYAGFTQDSETEPGSALLALTLAPGATDEFFAQSAVQSYLDSTAAAATPAPLPAAFWFFAAGLPGVRGLGKLKLRPAAVL
ncbi:MAG: hypothetical protein ABSB19_14090 [Methylomonas sp.]|jgi:hypothetical protein